MQRAKVVLVCSVGLALTGCDGSNGDESPSGSAPPPQLEAAPASAPAAGQPGVNGCEELTDAMVRRAAGLADDVKLVARPRHDAHGGCYYQWDNPDYDLAAAMRAGSQLVSGKAPEPSGKDLTHPKFMVGYLRGATYPDAAAAEKAFEQSQFHLPGMSATGQGAQSQPVPVRGVGDSAMWTASNPHIAVRDGRRLFFVNVRIGNRSAEQQRDIAEQLARDLVAAE